MTSTPVKGREIDARLARDRRQVERRLRKLLSRERGVPARLLAAMRYSLLGGGKRLRPLLALWTHDALARGEGTRDAALDVGAALEMIHTYSLIHDDLPAMDNDVLRRGRATCHVAFDEATAILAGDGLQALAFQVLAATPGCGDRLVQRVAAACGPAGMVGGQQDDLDGEKTPLTPSLVRRIHMGKTARMIGASVAAGGIVASDDEIVHTELDKAGRKLGLAFQAQDDVLDVVASSDVLGKTAGKDAVADKPTWVRLEGVQRAAERARRYGREGTRQLSRCLPEGTEATQRLLSLAGRLWQRDR
jgi:geranylgeranyl pyrophosphate synthase